MSLRVEYMDIPEGAQEAAVLSAVSAQPFSAVEQLAVGSDDTPWVTLEPGGWSLDGTGVLLEEDPSLIGWWSEQRSGADGTFTDPPVITVSFPQPYTATGITFRFWPSRNQWCSKMRASWYNGETLLEQVEAYPDASDWILAQTVEGFDKIVIELLATNTPGQFAKLQKLQIGQAVIFLQDEIVRVSLLNEVDPSLCQLSADTMTVEIRDRKCRSLMPQKNQSMRLYRDDQQIAAQYVLDSSREAQQYYTFRCQSAIGRLEGAFPGGMYTEKALTELLDEVLEGFSYSLDARLQEKTVTGFLPECTRREALQQIAFAVGAVVTTQGNGAIALSPPETEVGNRFDKGSIFTGAKVSRETQVAAVQLLSHSYDENGEDRTALWTRENPYVTVAEKGNVIRVENATLMHPENAEAALDRLYGYYQLNHVLTQEVVVTDQRAGQLVQSPNPWGTVTQGYITAMESEFTGTGHTANITIRGKETGSEEEVLTA